MAQLEAKRAEEFVVGACVAAPRTYWRFADQLRGFMLGDEMMRPAFSATNSLIREGRTAKLELVLPRMRRPTTAQSARSCWGMGTPRRKRSVSPST
mgnify:CR=1 FL=1